MQKEKEGKKNKPRAENGNRGGNLQGEITEVLLKGVRQHTKEAFF